MKRFWILLCLVLTASVLAEPMPLRQSTAVTVTLQQPFVDATDGYTREKALTVTGWACTLIKGATASTLTITASGGNNDAAHLAQGFYSLELTATNTNTLGHLFVDVNDPNARAVTSEFIVYPADTYDMLFTNGPSDSNDVADAVQVGMTAQGYTTTRGPYLDELAAANIPADVDTLKTRIAQTITFDNVGGTQMPKVNAGAINGVATTSVTTINANQGTTQPVNYTGTGATAYVKVDVVDWKGSAAPASTGDDYAYLVGTIKPLLDTISTTMTVLLNNDWALGE